MPSHGHPRSGADLTSQCPWCLQPTKRKIHRPSALLMCLMQCVGCVAHVLFNVLLWLHTLYSNILASCNNLDSHGPARAASIPWAFGPKTPAFLEIQKEGWSRIASCNTSIWQCDLIQNQYWLGAKGQWVWTIFHSLVGPDYYAGILPLVVAGKYWIEPGYVSLMQNKVLLLGFCKK